MQHGDLVVDAVLLAFQGFLGDALDGHQPLGPLLLGQDHLGEGSPETHTHTHTHTQSDPGPPLDLPLFTTGSLLRWAHFSVERLITAAPG